MKLFLIIVFLTSLTFSFSEVKVIGNVLPIVSCCIECDKPVTNKAHRFGIFICRECRRNQ